MKEETHTDKEHTLAASHERAQICLARVRIVLRQLIADHQRLVSPCKREKPAPRDGIIPEMRYRKQLGEQPMRSER